MQNILLIIGAVLVSFGVLFALLKREAAVVALVLLPGIVLCLASTPGLKTANFDFLGLHTNIAMQELTRQLRDGEINQSDNATATLLNFIRPQGEFERSRIAKLNSIMADATFPRGPDGYPWLLTQILVGPDFENLRLLLVQKAKAAKLIPS